MKAKKLLTAFLLGVSFCFVPALGYGEVKKWVAQINMDVDLLQIRISYMMSYPDSFLYVDLAYDPDGQIGRLWLELPEDVNTEDKICVLVRDNRGVFSDKSGSALFEEFRKTLDPIMLYIGGSVTDMDNDIVAAFLSRENNPLGYFYQGEYHLWEE